MFGDWGWNSRRTAAQENRYQSWKREQWDRRLVILEFGAGTGVPTVRHESQHVANLPEATLIRVNPRESEIPARNGISLAMGALDAIEQLLKP